MTNHCCVRSPRPKKGYGVAVSREHSWKVSMCMCEDLTGVGWSLGWIRKGRSQASMGILNPILVFPVFSKAYFSKEKKT